MEVFKHSAEAQSFKIRLLFCTTLRPLRLLSRNILREVCLYIGNSVLLPVIFQSSLRLFSLGSGKVAKEVSLPERFPLVSHFCLVSELQMFCLHHTAAFELRLDSLVLSAVAALQAPRFKPGLAALHSVVYVFGGLGLCTNERLQDGQWAQIASSKERSAFTPAVYNEEIYLWYNHDGKDGIDAYSPAKDQFRTHLIWNIYCDNLRNSVLVVQAGQVVFLTVDGRIVRKREAEKRPVVRANCCPVGWSKAEMSPIAYGNRVYWTSYGNVVEFDLDRDLVREVYHNIDS